MRELATLSQLQELQAQVKYWEQNSANYKQSIHVFKEYIDFIKTMNKPRLLINGYIRMGQYCEKMGDRLFAKDVYKEALVVEERINIEASKIDSLRNKITNLTWF